VNRYPKINTLYKRDDRGRLIDGEFSTPEIAFLSNLDWIWTEKVDGTNIRLGWSPDDEGVNVTQRIAGRSDEAQIPPHLLDVLITLHQDLPWKEAFPAVESGDFVTLYGEGYGAKIQSGGNYRSDPGFVLFDVQVGPWWLHRNDVVNVAMNLGLDVVPVWSIGPIASALYNVREGLVQSKWGEKVNPEGLVGQPMEMLFDRKGERILTKVKRKDFR
jgi:hypothetical protein